MSATCNMHVLKYQVFNLVFYGPWKNHSAFLYPFLFILIGDNYNLQGSIPSTHLLVVSNFQQQPQYWIAKLSHLPSRKYRSKMMGLLARSKLYHLPLKTQNTKRVWKITSPCIVVCKKNSNLLEMNQHRRRKKN